MTQIIQCDCGCQKTCRGPRGFVGREGWVTIEISFNTSASKHHDRIRVDAHDIQHLGDAVDDVVGVLLDAIETQAKS